MVVGRFRDTADGIGNKAFCNGKRMEAVSLTIIYTQPILHSGNPNFVVDGICIEGSDFIAGNAGSLLFIYDMRIPTDSVKPRLCCHPQESLFVKGHVHNEVVRKALAQANVGG